MLQFLDNLWRLFVFSNYLEEIDHFALHLLKKSVILKARVSEKLLFVDHPKEEHNEREFKPLIIGKIMNLSKLWTYLFIHLFIHLFIYSLFIVDKQT